MESFSSYYAIMTGHYVFYGLFFTDSSTLVWDDVKNGGGSILLTSSFDIYFLICVIDLTGRSLSPVYSSEIRLMMVGSLALSFL